VRLVIFVSLNLIQFVFGWCDQVMACLRRSILRLRRPAGVFVCLFVCFSEYLVDVGCSGGEGAELLQTLQTEGEEKVTGDVEGEEKETGGSGEDNEEGRLVGEFLLEEQIMLVEGIAEGTVKLGKKTKLCSGSEGDEVVEKKLLKAMACEGEGVRFLQELDGRVESCKAAGVQPGSVLTMGELRMVLKLRRRAENRAAFAVRKLRRERELGAPVRGPRPVVKGKKKFGKD